MSINKYRLSITEKKIFTLKSDDLITIWKGRCLMYAAYITINNVRTWFSVAHHTRVAKTISKDITDLWSNCALRNMAFVAPAHQIRYCNRAENNSFLIGEVCYASSVAIHFTYNTCVRIIPVIGTRLSPYSLFPYANDTSKIINITALNFDFDIWKKLPIWSHPDTCT